MFLFDNVIEKRVSYYIHTFFFLNPDIHRKRDEIPCPIYLFTRVRKEEEEEEEEEEAMKE